MTPYLLGGAAVILVLIGIVILVIWFTGSGRQSLNLFPTATPTVTITSTNTPVPPTLTFTPTVTMTASPTITLTPTLKYPFEYTVLEGESCWGIAEKFKITIKLLLAMNPSYAPACALKPGDKLMIPSPNSTLPPETPSATQLACLPGRTIKYTIVAGDTLATVAAQFNSTVDAILKENPTITNANMIKPGDVITIPCGVVTPTITRAPTITSTGGSPATTPAPTATKAP